jgi:hypothetical protein
MNLSQGAKGTWQIDVTAEYETPELTAIHLSRAIDQVKKIVEEKKLPLVQVV